MTGIMKFACDPVFVMIVHKGIEPGANGFQPLYVVGDFKLIVVIMTGINAFM